MSAKPISLRGMAHPRRTCAVQRERALPISGGAIAVYFESIEDVGRFLTAFPETQLATAARR
jgi:hypothetical protein